MLEIRLLGQFALQLDGLVAEIDSRPAQALLAYLALNAGTAQRREKLAGLIWPEATEDNARTYLRQALWRVRSAIGGDYLLADRITVSFNPEAEYWLDATELESEPTEGWTADSLIAAVSVYKGDLLPGFYEDWVMLERERLQAIFERRMDSLLKLLMEQSRWDDVYVWGERWIAMGGVPEPAYRALMRTHGALGNFAAVTAVYRRCAQALDELGVPPSPETTTLYQSLVKGETPAPSSPHKPDAIEVDEQPGFLKTIDRQRPIHREPFIGRERELAILGEHLGQALTGQGSVIFVTGEAGQGKTTLLREFARQAQAAHPELIVAAGACPVYTHVCAPYGIFREVLEILTGDVESAWVAGTVSRKQALRLWNLLPETTDALLQYGPNLVGTLIPAEGLMHRAISASADQDRLDRLGALVARSPGDDRGLSDQGDLFVEYADVLTRLSTRRPLLLSLDDLHWADASSIGLLGHLGHRLGENRILLVGAYRPEEVSQTRDGEPHPLAPILSEYKRRFGEVLLSLDEVEAENGRPFIDALLDMEPNALDEEFRQALTRHTGGHPLFTVELLREMEERGVLQQNEANQWVVETDFTWDVVPARVDGVIETRVNRLSPELRRWLEVASVEGESFTAEVIARSRDAEASEVVKRLSVELDRQHRLVVARGVRRAGARRLSQYRFRHHLFRQYLYNHMDEIERSYLHEQVGEALEELYDRRASEIADRLAYHFQMAGLAEKALTYLKQAGEVAAQAYANEEAITFFSQALNLARQPEEQDLLDEEGLITLFRQLGRTLEHNSDFEQALDVYGDMERIGRDRTMRQMTLTALSAQGTLYAIPSPVHDPKRAQAISKQALALAQELGDRAAEARVLWFLISACEFDNQLPKAIEFGERSLALARELKLRRQLAYTLNDLAGCYWVAGKFTKAKELFREAAVIWREFDNLPMLADVLFSSSLASMFEGEYDEAIGLSDESWQISQSIGNKWGLSLSRSRIGFVYRAQGEPGRGIKVMEESIRLGVAQDLPIPQIVTRAELAFDYACLGAADLGLDTANLALVLANEKGPSYRPYVLAAKAQCHLVNGHLDQVEAAIRQAKSDPYWQAFPVYCLAVILVEGQLALKRADFDSTWQLAEALLADLRRFGMRSYLPAALDLCGQALLGQGRVEEARARLLEAREEAEEMDAKGNLWPVLFHLSKIEPDTDEAERVRQEAQALVRFIADHAGTPELRSSFVALPEVRSLLESIDD